MMKKIFNHTNLILGMLTVVLFGYAVIYYNYFEIPSADFIGNFLPLIRKYMSGDFSFLRVKVLPLYPMLIAALAHCIGAGSNDSIYFIAITVNLLLFIPYIFLSYRIFTEFLSREIAFLATLFLGLNIFSIYIVVNSELEMLLILSVMAALYCSIKGRTKISFLFAFFATTIKLDTISIILSSFYADVVRNRKTVRALLLAGLACSGVATFVLLSVIYGNQYVKEISNRGPNIYKFPIDCLLITSSFSSWMAMAGYYSQSIIIRIFSIGFAVLFAITIGICMVWGLILITRSKVTHGISMLLYSTGFFIAHIIYQNSKERYVTPILWVLVLLLFYGLVHGLIPRINHKKGDYRFHPAAVASINIIMAIIGSVYLYEVVKMHNSGLLFISISLCILAVMPICVSIERFPIKITGILFSIMIVLMMIFYGKNTMDHYKFRYVEFKKIGEWYGENYRDGDKMLITEPNIVRYYSNFSADKFIIVTSTRSKDYENMISELKRLNVTYVFVDDFYIRRLKVNDKNAIEKKAHLLEEIRNFGVKRGDFTLVRTFIINDSIKSYLYSLKNSRE